MKQARLSLCYYPTTTLFIDDNRDFLDILQIGLTPYLHGQYLDNPSQVLQYLNNEYDLQPFTQFCLQNNSEEPVDHFTLNLNIRNIHQTLYHAKRFAEIAVIVVDYAMPDMDGLKLCQKITNPYLKKIMLTGEADLALAIKAFNEGDIHKFIVKNSQDLTETLLEAIQDLQKQYFIELTDSIFNRNLKNSQRPLACLNDPTFVQFFEALCQVNAICEYYVMDNQGSFLLLDSRGRASWLAVKTVSDMENYFAYAEQEQAPDSVITALKNKTGIVYFHTDHDLNATPDTWENFLYPAQPLQGEQLYYYAYIDDTSAYDISANKIVSYEQYLD